MYRCLVFILAFAVSGCVAAVATSGRVVVKDENPAMDVRFTDRDRGLIETYYKTKKKDASVRRSNLPAGIARRDKLPSGISADPLPRDLETKLSPPPVGTQRAKVGHDIVLMDGRTRVLFDVLYGIGD